MSLSNKFVYRESNFVVCENKFFFWKFVKKNYLTKICLLSKNLNVWKNLKKSIKYNTSLKLRHTLTIFLCSKCFFLIFCFDLINLLSTKFSKSFWTVFKIFDEFSRIFWNWIFFSFDEILLIFWIKIVLISFSFFFSY